MIFLRCLVHVTDIVRDCPSEIVKNKEHEKLRSSGGRSSEDQFNPSIHKLIVESASSGSQPKVRWEKVNVVGGKVYDQRHAGHTAVYHKVGLPDFVNESVDGNDSYQMNYGRRSKS